MFYERALESALIFICLAFQEVVPEHLAHYLGHPRQIFWFKVGWWIVLVATYLVLANVFRPLLRRLRMARGDYPQAALRGAWLQHVGNERPWGVAFVKYDHAADRWVYEGAGFDDAMNLRAEWQTFGQRVTEDGTKFTWHLGGEGTLLDQNGDLIEERSKFDIAVMLRFREDARRYGVTGKAADLNFQTEAGGAADKRDRIFGLTLTRLDRPYSIVQEVRRMSKAERAALFSPIRQVQAP